jgi:general secretion pathway protein G
MKECCETGAPKKRYWHWVLLGVVVLLAGALQVGEHQFDQGMTVKTRVDINAIHAALEEYATNNKGAYPASLQPLVTPDENGHCYLEGFSRHIPRDPWNHEYQYSPPTPEHTKPRVWSFGADGKAGGSGAGADIDSDRLQLDR